MDDLHVALAALNVCNGSHNLEKPSTIEKGVGKASDLENTFHDMLPVKDENLGSGSSLPSEDGGCSVQEDEITVSDSDMNLPSKSLHKCATFPVVVGSEKSSLDLQLERNSCTRSVSLPTTPKLVSAMKGSREEEGISPRKLSVSWAPDVYDPPPTSLSHLPKKKSQQHYKSNKKHGKGKLKGKNMRGGGSHPKDKKHYKKTGGRSERSLGSYSDTDRVLSNNYKSSVELLDFSDVSDIGGSDSNCATSFLGKAGGTVHFAYAEAT